jgi:hypothetical protein
MEIFRQEDFYPLYVGTDHSTQPFTWEGRETGQY